MKKIIGFIFGIFALILIFSACGGDTYAKKLDEEEKLIKKFRVDNGLTFLTKYPVDGVFKEKEYFYYTNGDTAVYFRVINPGNDEKAKPFQMGVSSGTRVTFRYNNTYTITDKAPNPTSNERSDDPIEFRYGEPNSYGVDANFMSYALAIPLRYVGNGGEVSLIVPFRSGSSAQNQYYLTLYYGSVKYKFLD